MHLLASYGFQTSEPTFDWATLIANKDKEIDRLEAIYGRLMGNAGVDLPPSSHGDEVLIQCLSMGERFQRKEF